jgi:phage-related protein
LLYPSFKRSRVYRLVYYRTARGESPVSDFVDSLPGAHQAKIASALGRLEAQGTKLGRPEVAHLKDRIWELRVQFGGIQYRILFGLLKQGPVLLAHGFVKKTQAVPDREIRTADSRLADYEARITRGEVKL